MERIKVNNTEYLLGYHTQECRVDKQLLDPIECTELNAWLGQGYYFWAEEEFAKYWGEDCKKENTGSYSIYKANLNIENCIDAVFNEKGYYFFKSQIENVIAKFKKEGRDISLKNVNDYLAEKVWAKKKITGIIYDDLPTNPYNKSSNRKYSVIKHIEGKNKVFYYRKRIQIVMFKIENISNFELYLDKQI